MHGNAYPKLNIPYPDPTKSIPLGGKWIILRNIQVPGKYEDEETEVVFSKRAAKRYARFLAESQARTKPLRKKKAQSRRQASYRSKTRSRI